MRQLLKFGLVLGAICFIATLVLALAYEITRPTIELRAKMEEDSALKKIMPNADSFNKKSIDSIDYFEAVREGQIEGYCVKAVGNGYSGYIRMIVGIDQAGTIKALEILEQSETPGLGAKIVKILPGDKEPYFTKQFKGKNASDVAVKKNIDGSAMLTINPERSREIDAITGATISSKAVTDAVNKTVSEFLSKVRK